MCKIVCWNASHRIPLGTIIREIGTAQEIGTETAVLLEELEIDQSDFHPSLISQIGQDFVLDPTQLQQRRDLRSYRSFTILVFIYALSGYLQ